MVMEMVMETAMAMETIMEMARGADNLRYVGQNLTEHCPQTLRSQPVFSVFRMPVHLTLVSMFAPSLLSRVLFKYHRAASRFWLTGGVAYRQLRIVIDFY